MRYTRQELDALPLHILRGIDIKSKEEEELVQEIINLRVSKLPLPNQAPLPSSKTDNMTPEKEKELQAEIDEKNAKARKSFSPEPVETIPEETETVEGTEDATQDTVQVETPEETPVVAPKKKGKTK